MSLYQLQAAIYQFPIWIALEELYAKDSHSLRETCGPSCQLPATLYFDRVTAGKPLDLCLLPSLDPVERRQKIICRSGRIRWTSWHFAAIQTYRLVNMISLAPNVHLVVEESRKVSFGNAPKIVGSSMLIHFHRQQWQTFYKNDCRLTHWCDWHTLRYPCLFSFVPHPSELLESDPVLWFVHYCTICIVAVAQKQHLNALSDEQVYLGWCWVDRIVRHSQPCSVDLAIFYNLSASGCPMVYHRASLSSRCNCL